MMEQIEINKLIYTNNNCQGCNRCIAACPIPTANYSVKSGTERRIEVHTDNCIACGACLDVCEHNARRFYDDTELFFHDLENGEQISLLIAPSFKANYPDTYEHILGALKAKGVNHIINVSFGADITTWGYINYLSNHDDFIGGISQPCPAVVNYIEHYAPELIEKLVPIHSPLLCAAIYLKKYMKIADKLAFISPCIAKKIEINDSNTNGYVSYNITFDHLIQYIRKNNLKGKPVSDELDYGLGFVYPMPGGLTENIYHFCGDELFIRQVEGERRAYLFLEDYKKRIQEGKELPFMADVLNCNKGCLYGTGIEHAKDNTDDNFYNLEAIKRSYKKGAHAVFMDTLSHEERLNMLNKHFNELDLSDFIRNYTDKSTEFYSHKPDSEELLPVFLQMKKDTYDKRHINCGACGYRNCKEMATAIFIGSNIPENCIHYIKDKMAEDNVKLAEQKQIITQKNDALIKAIRDEEESELFIGQVIRAFAKTIDISDTYTNSHSFRVAEYSRLIARKLGYSGKALENIYRIGLLHDIGKITVPKDILNKPGRLTDDEYEIIKRHASNGYDILKEISMLPNLAIGAGMHHERLDGRGYPNHKTNSEIPLIPRIIAVADTFDAMNSTRPYRKQMNKNEIVAELKKASGTQLDTDIVNILLELIEEGTEISVLDE